MLLGSGCLLFCEFLSYWLVLCCLTVPLSCLDLASLVVNAIQLNSGAVVDDSILVFRPTLFVELFQKISLNWQYGCDE